MEIQQVLRDYIINEGLKGKVPADFDNDYDLIESGILDSLLTINLVRYVEQQFPVQFGINDIVPRHFRSINALTDYVQTRQEVEV